MDIREVTVKSILSPCNIPGIDFTLNPYTGCSFGCVYCYASFMGRFVGGKKISDWGNYVFAKINAPELLTKEVKTKLKNRGKDKEVFLSSVTDPYQGMEAKYQLTRKCLQVLVDHQFEGLLSILTKSKLVLRDIDLFKKFPHITVGLTVTSTDDQVSRFFEKKAPNVSQRFKALRELNRQGIKTYAFVGPLLPHFVANQKNLEKIFVQLKKVGTSDIYVEHLNLSNYIRSRLMSETVGLNQAVRDKFYASQSKAYRQELDQLVKKLVAKYELNLITDMVIFHREYQQLNQ